MKDKTLAEWLRQTDMEFVPGNKLPPRLLWPTVADFKDLREQLRKPNLGPATTRELLNELRVRGQVGMITEEQSTDHQHLEADASHLLSCLSREVLDYRTVDHV